MYAWILCSQSTTELQKQHQLVVFMSLKLWNSNEGVLLLRMTVLDSCLLIFFHSNFSFPMNVYGVCGHHYSSLSLQKKD
jgi:hypothetical protein